MLILSENIEEFRNEFCDVVNLFSEEDINIEIILDIKEIIRILTININKQIFEYSEVVENENSDIIKKRKLKKFLKSNFYFSLSKYFNKNLMWGALTGIRPAKLVYDKINEGKNFDLAVQEVEEEYYLSSKKRNLLEMVVKNQLSIISKDNSQCFYVHIPICPSRCTYCSFVATDFKNAHKYLEDYLIKLKEEIIYSINKIKDNNININSIYVGGGTPTVLNADQLEYLLEPLKELRIKEFTVECGRPDTITKEKLESLKKLGVSRISINPQTFNDKILETIGRKHTGEDVIKSFNLAKEIGFQINMDLIAGLPNDTFESFENSIKQAIALNPANITVHTLSIKNAGLLKYMNNASLPNSAEVERMLDDAYLKLKQAQYLPYYLYRQKNMLGFFENVGYSKKDNFCLFNIYSMEDMKPVIACGAGAISKKIHFETNKIERVANVKQITDYLERFEEMIKRKDYLLD